MQVNYLNAPMGGGSFAFSGGSPTMSWGGGTTKGLTRRAGYSTLSFSAKLGSSGGSRSLAPDMLGGDDIDGEPQGSGMTECCDFAGDGINLGDVSSVLNLGDVSSVLSPADPKADLFSFLGLLMGDGGVPGENIKERVLKTAVLALAALDAESASGVSIPIYGMHLDRMANFLAANVDVWGATETLVLVNALRSRKHISSGDWFKLYGDLEMDGGKGYKAAWKTVSKAVGA